MSQLKKESLREIVLNGQRVAYSLKNSSARRLRLAIYLNGEFKVFKPRLVSILALERFIRLKSDWILSRLKQASDNPGPRLTRNDYLKNKEAARKLVVSRLEHYQKILACSYRRLSIRDQKTRWGSCSKQGNLNFSYRILFLSEEQCDYIIVHELCHLLEFNHSPRFWSLVEQVLPNYKEIRKTLIKNII